jgi:hypothetical protein
MVVFTVGNKRKILNYGIDLVSFHLADRTDAKFLIGLILNRVSNVRIIFFTKMHAESEMDYREESQTNL